MRGCKHNIVRSGREIASGDYVRWMGFAWCSKCGEWLSLGPANDTGCEVEIRAASMAADSRLRRAIRLNSCPFDGGCCDDWDLARCIVEHREGK